MGNESPQNRAMPQTSNLNPSAVRRIETVDTPRVMKRIIDESTVGTTYIGEALPGTATSVARWQIMKIVEAASVTTITWADGNGAYDKEWDERANYEYR